MTTEVRIRRKTGDDIVATYLGNLYDLTVGDSIAAEFRFPPTDGAQTTLTVSGTYTVPNGTEEAYTTVTVQAGATLVVEQGATLYANTIDNDGTIENDGTIWILDNAVLGSDAWVEMQQTADYGGSYTLLEALDSTPNFKQFLPTGADVDSLVVGIEPSTELQNDDVTGIWALVDGGTDTRNVTLSEYRYQLRLTVLADLDDYADHAALENDLEY